MSHQTPPTTPRATSFQFLFHVYFPTVDVVICYFHQDEDEGLLRGNDVIRRDENLQFEALFCDLLVRDSFCTLIRRARGRRKLESLF